MKNFRFNVLTILRIIIILFLCVVFGFIFGKPDLFFSNIIVVSLIILLTFELIRFVSRTNRNLQKLLISLVHHDYSASFGSTKMGRSFEDLSEAFNEIIKSFRNVKIEKEAQLQLLQVIIDQINIGVIAVKEKQDIVFVNKTATDLLNIPGLRKWNIDVPLIQKIDEEVSEMKSEGNKLLELKIGDEMRQLAFHTKKTVFMEDTIFLMTFHDIRSEIEQKEIEAWYKLIRILTHEVMNSITPLSSLTETILMLLENKDKSVKNITEMTNDQLIDIRESIKTIQGRSEGILEFVDAYRRLTNIPHPEFEQVKLESLINEVYVLFKSEFASKAITFEPSYQNKDISIQADQNLLGQVMINLVSNSIYALENVVDPRINIKVYTRSDKTLIEVSDNGKGIPEDKIDKIFIPFFSTREDGSGIGLSLSKQIVHLHHGRIKVKSSEGKGTTFRVEI